MKSKVFVFTMILIFLPLLTLSMLANHSPTIPIVWQKTFGGSGGDETFSIQQTTDGGYIIVGFIESNDGDVSGNHGNADFWVVKLK